VILAATFANLPDDNTGYVAAAYLVLFALILIYVGIMTAKLVRLEREVVELNELADKRPGGTEPAQPEEQPTPEHAAP
jgi:hypothetical protein